MAQSQHGSSIRHVFPAKLLNRLGLQIAPRLMKSWANEKKGEDYLDEAEERAKNRLKLIKQTLWGELQKRGSSQPRPAKINSRQIPSISHQDLSIVRTFSILSFWPLIFDYC